jgi:branched-chain amino acid transport system ATP-binding protein
VLLEVKGLSKHFGGLQAVNNIDMSINAGQIAGLIGPNGAGKTTIFNLLTGFLKPSSGKVFFNDTDITGKSPHIIASKGIGRTFQLTPLFSDFTTLQNIVASCYLHPKQGFWQALFNTPSYRRNEAQALATANEILQLVGLSKVKDELAKNLPHGYQKMLGIARALAVKPKLLLLDEPLGGLNTDEIAFTLEMIVKLRQQGITVLIIEHNMQILNYCDHVVAINFGQKICDGTAAEIRKNPEVIKAYLGEQNAA